VATGIGTDERFLQHQPPSMHPERVARLEAIHRALAASGVAKQTVTIASRPATAAELGAVHSPEYLSFLESLAGQEGWIDPDTYYSEKSWEAARYAAGATCELAEQIADGKIQNGFAFVRPPGHHATRHQAMGFCLINNVAVAARKLERRGYKVSIFDWDVHHGNGTQDIFYDDGRVQYLSTHEWPQYPGTGRADEVGLGEGAGATVNVPLSAGTAHEEYLAAFRTRILPPLREFAPDILLVSAGFDAHTRDPIGGLELVEETYAEMTRELKAVQPRIGMVLEGGYDLDALARSSMAVLEVLMTQNG
jgi:acetoin utilization deacetylase AcuC-like enzyme